MPSAVALVFTSEIAARALVIAVDAPAAALLLAPLDAEAAQLAAAVAYAPIASVSLGVAEGATRTPVSGFGFLVPRDLGVDLLGGLFMSQLFASRAPAGHELITALIGGARWRGVVDAADAEIERRVLAGIDRALGLRGVPRTLAISRWTHAVPQPGVDHVARIAALRRRFAGDAGLALAGAWLDGVAVGDLLLVHGWLAPCRDRIRLVEVVRVAHASHDLLRLGATDVLGRPPRHVADELMRRWAQRTGREAPTLVVERRASDDWSASAEEETYLRQAVREDRACDDDRDPQPLRRRA